VEISRRGQFLIKKESIYEIREEVKSNRKSKRKRSKSPIEEGKSKHVEKLSKFKTNIYDRARKIPGKRVYSVLRQSVSKKLKSKVPSEKKKLDKKKYKLADLAKSRITTASREGKSPEKNTAQFHRTSDSTDNMGIMTCSIVGASKGRLTETNFERMKTPNKNGRKTKLKSGKKKRLKSVPKKDRKQLMVSPSKTMIIYDFDESGYEIIRQETIHEYKERMGDKGKHKRAVSGRKMRVNRNWDQSKCRKHMEFDRIIKDAWNNIDQQQLNDYMVTSKVYEP
jgi:hypothetical protein